MDSIKILEVLPDPNTNDHMKGGMLNDSKRFLSLITYLLIGAESPISPDKRKLVNQRDSEKLDSKGDLRKSEEAVTEEKIKVRSPVLVITFLQ
jgi:hypothetical protein